MKSFTKQQTYNRVKKHLLTQNAKAEIVQDGLCRYRSPSGRKCAVGCLIADTAYNPDMEGLVLGCNKRDATAQAQLDNAVQGHNIKLLLALQAVHDGYEAGEWPAQLRLLAKKHRLRP